MERTAWGGTATPGQGVQREEPGGLVPRELTALWFSLNCVTQNLLKPILGSYSRVVHREPSPAQRRGLGLPALDLGMRGPACLRSWCCPGTDRPPAVNIQ